MVQFDDFHRLEEPCRLLGELHGQHGTDREVGRDEDGDVGFVGQPFFDLRDAFIGEAGGAHDRVDACRDQEVQVVHHDAGMGEVDDHLGLAVRQQGQRVARVHTRGERQVVGSLDRIDDRCSDLAFGAKYSHSHGWQA